MIRILHTVGGLHPNSGGPSRTVSRLAAMLSTLEGFEITLLSQGIEGQPTIDFDAPNLIRSVATTKFTISARLGLPFLRGLQESLLNHRPGLIHDHGVWLPSNNYVAHAARKRGIPVLIQPRGMLEPWAMQYRKFKKRFAMVAYQKKNLDAAKLFFATADQEAESIRRLGFRQPIAVIPNGVELDEYRSRRSGKSESDERIVLFMSRIHPKKGLLNLIEAWGRLRPRGWCLHIAGPDEGGHLDAIMRRVRSLGLCEAVKYAGVLEGNSKIDALVQASVFVLPSFSENFGVVVAEALAQGTPVITTTGTPWEGLIQHQCGWWIAPTVDEITNALSEVFATDEANLRKMGEKGRVFARDFDWHSIALQTGSVYRWILGVDRMPNCVRLS